MTEDGELESKDFVEAFERVGRTEDGLLLYLYFQKTLCGTMELSPLERALPEHEGRRKFASELMGLMAKGIKESGGSSSVRPVVFAKREPVAISRRTTAREFFRDNPDVDPTDRRGGAG